MKANPRFTHFARILEKRSEDWLAPWTGDCWRYQDVDFPSPSEILSGEGAYRHGGRWNGVRSFPAVYGSTDDVTATRESAAVAKYFGFPLRKPRLFVCIRCELTRVLDLTDGAVRRALGITLKEIESEDWRKLQGSGKESLSQSLGRAARECGAEALLVPSFANRKGVNVAVFAKDLDGRSRLSIWDEKKLLGILKKR